ncbi:unnamed protein product [Malassezia sympodialis ATCC 42132]|uniref:NudC domain-containing protein 1 n=1 Tax=Malassezia sympodialis (strain ATCC 42132) TaxID=1230383 RepID=M5E7Q9_MALS4|nr:uncharacterized protein MSY001_0842 [Malassezia sympodialis ATCC 42132]CCU98136.1 unnamed protein product [Malassezia sympodialis ATCC 42132]SHO76105.1 Uncharacterized protein MSYG_0440 [Malassezia sympodialis ATCC 42132]|eukprot:XP_018739457.1 uncharacterized protein MSY001_0842 [Malassezia sympodialis ATCC 42132]
MFPIDRAHANPAFEAYKLGEDNNVSVHQVPLPQRVLGTNANAAVPLAYKKLKARAMHSPLATHDGTAGAYIAEDGRIILLSWADAAVSCLNLCSIPSSVYSRTSDHLPTLVAVDASTWLACGDSDTLLWVQYIRSSGNPGASTCVLTLPTLQGTLSEAQYSPWTLVQATADSDGPIYALLQRACRVPAIHQNSGASSVSHTFFDVMLIRAAFSIDEEAHAAELMWCVECHEPVAYACIANGACLLGAEAPFMSRSVANKPDAGLASQRSCTSAPTLPPLEKAPYTWTQTGDTVMVALALPEYIRAEDIRAHFSLHGLSVSLAASSAPDPSAAMTPGEQVLRDGAFTSQSVWAQLDPTGSVWTLEPGASMQLLTLHLAKAHEGTRWPHVFAHDDGVLETLDPSELSAMLQGLDKYAQPLPSSTLLHDTLEDDVNDGGTPLQLAWVTPDGHIEMAPASSHALLARATPPSDPALLLQHDVDGQVFVPPSPLAWAPWRHVATVPAISYVLASKRDIHPVYVYRGTATPTVLAAEPRYAPDAHSRGSHLYMYGATSTQRGTSYVWPVGDPVTGPVLGLTVAPDGRVVCLCATALLVLTEALPATLASASASTA